MRTEALFLSERPPSGHEGHGSRRLPSEHSEHRASPVKRFYLNLHELSEDARAFVLRPDGSIKEATLNHDEGVWVVSFDTKPMDGSMDGIFNLYVIDKQMIDKTLLIRIAKMNVINHSCGWGHKFKFDKERLRPKYNDSVPLEVVAYDLWDRNFHSRSASGDRLLLSVLSYGKPVKADLRVRTEGGWMKSMKTDDDGRASFQLIREYYTERWRDFNSRKRTGLMITAQYEVQENGFYKGQPYERIRLITSLPWRYQVSRAEYSSYAYGLLILTIFSVASGLAVYLYRQRRRA
ncbi:MAG: hypothetical protein OHK0032_03840 [Thermodesulfovibrionales bacterium]